MHSRGHLVVFSFKIILPFLLFSKSVNGTSCMGKLNNVKDFQTASSTCLTKLELKREDIPMNSVQLVKQKYEDKCFSKCVMETMKFVTESITIHTEEILKVIKENAPADIQSHMKEIITKCATSTERLTKLPLEDGGVEKSSCKYFAMFHHCFSEQEQLICKET